MNTHKYSYASLMALVMLFMAWQPAAAQHLRPEGSLFIRPSVGLSSYLGDNEKTPFNFNLDAFEVDGKVPFAAGVELGYQFNPNFALSAGYNYGQYPVIVQRQDELEPLENRDTHRHTGAALLRYTFNGDRWRAAPYVNLGFNVTGGYTDPTTGKSILGYGPLAGLGLDYAITDQTSLMFEWNSDFSVPDKAVDGRGNNGFADFDMLNQFTIGVKYNFRGAFVPVEVFSVQGPESLETMEEGTFTATSNLEEASTPVTYTWDFGDGTRDYGLTATHTYANPGTYTVTFTANNNKSSDQRTMSVIVVPPPVPAEIVSMTASPMVPNTQTPVQFLANAAGDVPVTYEWSFGDGATAGGASATHTYSEPGTYEVTLIVSNPVSSDTRSMEITVVPFVPEYCSTLEDMNAVFFNRNSSVLTDEGRDRLMENVVVLNDCTNVNVVVEGWAAANERNTDDLSADRARAVEAFYIDNGLDASRIVANGRGSVGQVSTKEGAPQYRRADSIPQQ